MAYRNAIQADALKLVARKLQNSLAVEGELPEEGLAAYGDDPVPGTGQSVRVPCVPKEKPRRHDGAWKPQLWRRRCVQLTTPLS